MNREVLTARETAEVLGIHYQVVIEHLARGDLVGVKRGNRWYIRRTAVDDFLDPSWRPATRDTA